MSLQTTQQTSTILCCLGYLLPKEHAVILENLYKAYKTKYNLPDSAIPNPPPHIPFLRAKLFTAGELSKAEVFFEEWADRQKPVQTLLSDTYTLFDQTLYIRGSLSGNTFATDLTQFFYVAFPEQEKDMSEPLQKLWVPFLERNGGPKQDLVDIANELTTEEVNLLTTIDSVSIIGYNTENKTWEPLNTFKFKAEE